VKRPTVDDETCAHFLAQLTAVQTEWDELSYSVITAAWKFNEDESDRDYDDSDDEFGLRIDTDGRI
jgi:hypothetical protein